LYSYVIQIYIPGVTGAALVRLDSMSEADNSVPPTRWFNLSWHSLV